MQDPNIEQLPPVRTPIDPDQLGTALCGAWKRVLGTYPPSRAAVLVLIAQSSLETGHWAACECWNLGNVKSHEGDGRCWTYFRCSEIIGGQEIFFNPPSPQCRFRAFRTLEDGAADHVGFLALSDRYQKAWTAAMTGDPHAFVRELKQAGYFTAAEPPYEATVAKLFSHYDATLTFEVPVDPVEVTVPPDPQASYDPPPIIAPDEPPTNPEAATKRTRRVPRRA
jgi:hypothetical protein